jgi:hypothetical protein
VVGEMEGRLDYERARLDAFDITNELDDDAFKKGSVVLNLQADVEGEKVSLIARFPDFYPSPVSRSRLLNLILNTIKPLKKNLCLIGQNTENWNTDDTLADFIRDRLPTVLKTGRSDDPDESRGLKKSRVNLLAHIILMPKIQSS